MLLASIANMYNIEDPLISLNKKPPTKATYKENIKTKILAYHEKELRNKSSNKESMRYFNVSLLSLSGRPHPAISNVTTTHEVRKMRPHIKILTGNYFTLEQKSIQSGGSPLCLLCDLSESESIEHLISRCTKISEIRDKIINSINDICKQSRIDINLNEFTNGELTQFILDASSLNLKKRINILHPALPSIFHLSRDLCFAIDKFRRKFVL